MALEKNIKKVAYINESSSGVPSGPVFAAIARVPNLRDRKDGAWVGLMERVKSVLYQRQRQQIVV